MDDNARSLDSQFARIREALGIPSAFPDTVLDAARACAARELATGEEREDLRAVPFVTIDPSGSRDLDQAFYAERSDGGFRVLYAIADVGYFVDRGSPVEAEAWRRGETLYSPDLRTPLYPPELSEGAASLLPDVDRPSIAFDVACDARGVATLSAVRRAVVRSRAQLAYEDVERHLAAERAAAGSGEFARTAWAASLGLLEELGRARQRLAEARGAVSLPVAAQHVTPWKAALHGYKLAFDDPDAVEGWNAEISLMTGMLAAELMARSGIGLLRSLDPPRPDRVEALRLTAAALGVAWPDEASYAEFIRSLDATNPVHAAVIYHAAGAMGGARYEAFVGDPPERARHAAIASFYAHVTAPLRRLADRYALDLLVELARGERPDAAVAEVLPALPPVMEAADRLGRTLDAAMVDFAEALVLADRAGEVFDALVIRVRADSVTVQITEPPVRADVSARALFPDSPEKPRRDEDGSAIESGGERVTLGSWLRLRLVAADPSDRRVTFELAPEREKASR